MLHNVREKDTFKQRISRAEKYKGMEETKLNMFEQSKIIVV